MIFPRHWKERSYVVAKDVYMRFITEPFCKDPGSQFCHFACGGHHRHGQASGTDSVTGNSVTDLLQTASGDGSSSNSGIINVTACTQGFPVVSREYL